MTQQDFLSVLQQQADVIEQIRLSAHQLHQSVGQTYGSSLPYGYHLDGVVGYVRRFAHHVLQQQQDILPLVFAAYYHDSIEDARLTYNDVKRTAQRLMNAEQALMAAEIVYALTNDKGRTREERAGQHYYDGIRHTPYAPFTKLCDRLANVYHSCANTDTMNTRMKDIYSQEMPHFLNNLRSDGTDPRLQLPQDAVTLLRQYVEGSDK